MLLAIDTSNDYAGIAIRDERDVHGFGRVPAGDLGASDEVGGVAKKHGVDHPSSLVARIPRDPRRGARGA